MTSAAVTVRYADYHPEASNSAVSAIRNKLTITQLPPLPEPEWVIDWLIRIAEEAPPTEVAKLPTDFAAKLDHDLYGV